MKKYYFLIIVALILGLALAGCTFLSNIGQAPTTEQSGVSGIFKDLTTVTPICIGFEETEFTPGKTVTGEGKVYPFLKISSSGSELNLVVIEEGGTDVSYNSSGGDNGCLDGVKGFGPIGAGTSNRPLDTNTIIFEFSPGFTVSTFSINMYDYGDYIHIFDTVNAGEFEVDLNAYADDGTTLINSDSYLISGGKNNIYDACKSSGMEELSVAGPGISKVEIEFTKNIDIGVGFDKICFTPETNICTTDLIAGQTENVGNVEVKYTLTDDFITVTYSTESSDWLLDEIHFHAASNLPDSSWPVTKKGNPIPGHFYKVIEGLGGIKSKEFTIDLADIGVDCGTIYFAAHTAVYKLSDVIDDKFIVSGSDTSEVFVYDVDPVTNPAAFTTNIDISKIVNFAAWDNIVDLTTDFPLARWIIEYYDPLPPWDQLSWDPTKESWRLFTRNFDISSNAVNISGMLKITADNAEQISLNSNIVGSNGDWKTINSYTLNSGELIAEDNELDIIVHNYSAASSSVNPTGLIYKLEYQYQLKTEESAWGDGPGFPGAKNWSMFFVCPNLVPCPF